MYQDKYFLSKNYYGYKKLSWSENGESCVLIDFGENNEKKLKLDLNKFLILRNENLILQDLKNQEHLNLVGPLTELFYKNEKDFFWNIIEKKYSFMNIVSELSKVSWKGSILYKKKRVGYFVEFAGLYYFLRKGKVRGKVKFHQKSKEKYLGFVKLLGLYFESILKFYTSNRFKVVDFKKILVLQNLLEHILLYIYKYLLISDWKFRNSKYKKSKGYKGGSQKFNKHIKKLELPNFLTESLYVYYNLIKPISNKIERYLSISGDFGSVVLERGNINNLNSEKVLNRIQQTNYFLVNRYDDLVFNYILGVLLVNYLLGKNKSVNFMVHRNDNLIFRMKFEKMSQAKNVRHLLNIRPVLKYF